MSKNEETADKIRSCDFVIRKIIRNLISKKTEI